MSATGTPTNGKVRARSGLTTTQTRRSLGSFVWHYSFRGVFDTVCGGTTLVFVAYALALGIAKERMGFVTSIISLACIIQLLSLPLANRMRDKKRFVLFVAIAEPCLMILAAALTPVLPEGMRFYFFAGAVFMAAASLNMTKPLTDEWLASTVPAGLRGRYLGRRLQVFTGVVIVTALASGYLLERMGRTNLVGLSGILIVGGLCGLLSVFSLRRATMPSVSASSRVGRDTIKEMWRSRPFVRCLAGTLIYNLPFLLTLPYYQVFNLTVVGMRETVIAMMGAGYCLTKILAAPLMGRLLDRWGTRRMIYLISPIYVLFFAAFPFCGPGRAWPLIAVWVLAGVGDSAYMLGITNALYGAVPETPARPAYFAVFNLLSLGIYGVGGLLAVPILEALKGVTISLGPFVLGHFHLLFGVSGLMMIPCLFGAQLFPGKRQLDRPPTRLQ